MLKNKRQCRWVLKSCSLSNRRNVYSISKLTMKLLSVRSLKLNTHQNRISLYSELVSKTWLRQADRLETKLVLTNLKLCNRYPTSLTFSTCLDIPTIDSNKFLLKALLVRCRSPWTNSNLNQKMKVSDCLFKSYHQIARLTSYIVKTSHPNLKLLIQSNDRLCFNLLPEISKVYCRICKIKATNWLQGISFTFSRWEELSR